MQEVIDKFELDVVSDKSRGVIALSGKERTWQIARAIVAQTTPFVITDDVGKKVMKGWRADLKKIIDAIDRKRIDTIDDFTQEFASECNSLKTFFESARNAIDIEIKKYEEAQKAVSNTVKPKKYVATVKFTDEKLIKKLTDFCTKNGCELTIK